MAVLPEFPNVKEIKLPESLDATRVSTFLMMYRTHSQRLMDVVIRANFDEVQTLLNHFWQGVPSHLSQLFQSNSVINLIGACDGILYKSIASVLSPSVIQSTLPEPLSKILKRFSSQIDHWISLSLNNMSSCVSLKDVKICMAKKFGSIVRRQISLSKLVSGLRMVLSNIELVNQMVTDWISVDFDMIIREIVRKFGEKYEASDHQEETLSHHHVIMRSGLAEFTKILQEDPSIESLLEWIESMVNRCIIAVSIY